MSALPQHWDAELRAAFSFLTRLPVSIATFTVTLAQASWAFPLVGIVVGLIGGIAYLIAASLNLPPLAAALIAVAATILVTGGLHEDGLADTADGFGGGRDRAHKLEIMRDSRIGTYGVLALIVGVGLRVTALAQIGGGWHALGALIAAQALARGIVPAAMHYLPPARDDGLGANAGRPEQNIFLIAAAIGLVIALFGIGLRPALIAAVAAASVAAVIGWLAQRQIGGQTGDVLGAIEQGGEIAILLTAAAWA